MGLNLDIDPPEAWDGNPNLGQFSSCWLSGSVNGMPEEATAWRYWVQVLVASHSLEDPDYKIRVREEYRTESGEVEVHKTLSEHQTENCSREEIEQELETIFVDLCSKSEFVLAEVAPAR